MVSCSVCGMPGPPRFLVLVSTFVDLWKSHFKVAVYSLKENTGSSVQVVERNCCNVKQLRPITTINPLNRDVIMVRNFSVKKGTVRSVHVNFQSPSLNYGDQQRCKAFNNFSSSSPLT